MQHKCRVKVIDERVFPEYQEKYLADPCLGECPFYQIGDVTVFERYGQENTSWIMSRGAHCAEAWDCISRYIYTALQGESIMRGWISDKQIMIACYSDGTRPVIFKIECVDYEVVKIDGMKGDYDTAALAAALERVPGVKRVDAHPKQGWVKALVDEKATVSDEGALKDAVRLAGKFTVTGID